MGDLARFDAALALVLQLAPPHLPAHVYELPSKVTAGICGDPDRACYVNSKSGVTVVAPEYPPSSGLRNWGAFFGYAGGLVTTGRASRSPLWFRVGIPALFAPAEIDSDRVKMGRVDPNQVSWLAGRKLIPTRVLLEMDSSDPQLANNDYERHFQAESWYLAREVFVEGMLRPEFDRYLELIRNGTSEPEAFSGSFKLSYEELDKQLYDALSKPVHLYVLNVPRAAPSGGEPRRLSPAEVDALLAELRMRFHHANW